MKNADAEYSSERVRVLNTVSVSDCDEIGTTVGVMNIPVALLGMKASLCASEGRGCKDGVEITIDI